MSTLLWLIMVAQSGPLTSSPAFTTVRLHHPISSLEKRALDLGWITPALFQVTDRNIYVSDFDRLVIFEHDGSLKNTYELPYGFWIGNFALIPHMDLLAVCALSRDENKRLFFRIFFADREGNPRGIAYDPTLENPRNAFFRQIFAQDP